MSTFARLPHACFAKSRASETIAEVALTVAAAGFTAAMWLSIGGWIVAPSSGTAQAMASGPATRITLPTVVIVGRRNSLEPTPVATTAQNTAGFPVNLRQ
jgi:hypothetical protein